LSRRPTIGPCSSPTPLVSRATLVAALALCAAACQGGEVGTAGCETTLSVSVAASPLTLLASARLDRVATGLALTGVDLNGATVRWARVDAAAGALGAEQSLTVPVGGAGPWLALTSDKSPGDTVLVAEAQVAANGADAELHVIAAPATASSATAPALGPVLAVIPGAFAGGASPSVALAASRSGPYAVLAWIDPAAGAVTTLNLSAAGEPIGDKPTVLDTAAAFGCLAFVPGKGAFTLGYHSYADTKTRIPTFVITDLFDGGSSSPSTLSLLLDAHAAGCPQVTPTDGGYAIAFQDGEGSWLGAYDDTTKYFTISPFAPAAAFGGAALQPSLVGIATMGTDFAVAVAGPHGGELWRIEPSGGRRSGRVIFPSMLGDVGGISTQPSAGSLMATYADYSSRQAGVGTAGQRFFLGVSCQ
jgi:hypothetical protein